MKYNLRELEAPIDPHAYEIIRIDNGVYNVKTPDSAMLAVHELCADNQLTEAARELGQHRDKYQFYQGPARVVPLYELSQTSRAVAEFVGGKENAIHSTLKFNFPNYLEKRGLVGVASFASGETISYTDASEYISVVKEELPYRNTSGFSFTTLTANPNVRKAVDDLIYNEYGEDNPRELEDYLQPNLCRNDNEPEYGDDD